MSADAPERIVAAAMLHEGEPWHVPIPGRHVDVVIKLDAAFPGQGPFAGDQGFMTSAGRFVEREEAGRIALAAGQTKALRWPPELFSEDLW
jgi:hypothetical protein